MATWQRMFHRMSALFHRRDDRCELDVDGDPSCAKHYDAECPSCRKHVPEEGGYCPNCGRPSDLRVLR